jgi:hypothetical protein
VTPLLEAAVLFGEVKRAEVPSLVGTSDRQARRCAWRFRREKASGCSASLAPSAIAAELPPLPEIAEALRGHSVFLSTDRAASEDDLRHASGCGVK